MPAVKNQPPANPPQLGGFVAGSLSLEDSDDLFHRQPLGFGQVPGDERDGHYRETSEQHHHPRQPDRLLQGREDFADHEVGQPVDACRDRRPASANIGREDLALDQPARSTDTDRERGDVEGETHHHDRDLRRSSPVSYTHLTLPTIYS